MSKAGVSRRGFLARSSAALVATASLPAATQAASAPRTTLKDRPMLWPAPFDVVVAGSGPAGIGAALASARMGAKTLLLERHAFFGGMAAWGLGMPMRQMRPGGRPRGNVHEALIARLGRYGPEAATLTRDAVVCNAEYLKVAALDLLDEARCAYLTHTQVVDAIVKKDRVAGLVAATKRGLMHVESQVVVDATGDADVAAFAGAATMKGKEGNAYLSPMTLLILVASVDVERARQFAREGNLKRLLEKAATKYPELPQKMVFELGPHPLQQCLVVNHSGTEARGTLDGSSLDDMTEAERYGRRQAIQIVSALREFGGAPFARAQLAGTGPQIGVRDTRRVKGLYVLTEEDAKSGRHFDDAVAWRSGSLETGFETFQDMKVHDVPYRALVPEKVDGLLAAGRCISVTHAASAAGRNMGNCMATGHAAGIAAALAAAKHKEPRDIKAALIREALAKDGVSMQPASAS